MAAPTRKRLAFDANVLIDLASGVDAVLTLLEVLIERGSSLQISPTVVQELSFLLNDLDEVRSTAALKALQSLREWQITPFDIPSVSRVIADEFSRYLINKALLPPSEYNDGRILGEAALAKIPILVTSDKHLLSIEQPDLIKAFNARDLDVVTVIHPRQILKSLSQNKKHLR